MTQFKDIIEGLAKRKAQLIQEQTKAHDELEQINNEIELLQNMHAVIFAFKENVEFQKLMKEHGL